MLVGSVACINNGYGGYLAGILGRTLNEMAHGYHVGIVRHHQDGVFQRFAFGAAGHFRVGKADDLSPKTVGGSLKTKSCTGGRLKEKRCHNLSFQQFPIRLFLKLLRHLD